ncbi:MAG: hypothetical protein K2P94_03405 [Rhodospirillaceae bacterium]|nr:hypothetical protein [Rhodospirillaceae bacterium]
MENKRLGAVLAWVADTQAARTEERSRRCPRRRGQSGHMFAVPKVTNHP